MKKIYTIETHWYDNFSIKTYEDRKEWEEAIDMEASGGSHAGNSGEFEVAIYEVDDNNGDGVHEWRGMVYHSASRDRYATVDSIPESWERLDSQVVSYYNIMEDEDSGMWIDDGGFEFSTEDEAHEGNKASDYLII